MYQASLFDRPRQQPRQQNPGNTTSPAKPPEQITIIQTPPHEAEYVLPIDSKAGVTFIET